MQWLNTSQETYPEALSVTCGHRGRLPHFVAGWIVWKADSRMEMNMQEGCQAVLLRSMTIEGEGRKPDRTKRETQLQRRYKAWADPMGTLMPG